ncbi:hypothetical protein [Arsenophonus sp.]|uniref:hypothetical protein n=1 Tax=Arsenophonus sp. TaxID=1872640 RepID=UPI00387A5992
MNNWYFDRDRGFKLTLFSMVILFAFYPVFAIADAIAINNNLSNKSPFYAYEHGKYYEGYDRHSIALRAFEDEKVKNNGVVYCMPSRSCQFKKITSISDVGIFSNVRVDYVGILISGLGEGSEGAGFYTVSVLKNDNYHESADDKRKACLARPVQKGTYDNVYNLSSG